MAQGRRQRPFLCRSYNRESPPSSLLAADRADNARFSYTRMGRDNARGGQRALLTGRAHLSNLLPYQCRAQHAGHCSVAVEGGRVPTADGLLHLHILTSGGFRCAVPRSPTQSAGRWKNLLAASLPLVYENIMGPCAAMPGIVLSTGQCVTKAVRRPWPCAASRVPLTSERSP
jgi:hypothetical protein